MSKKLPANAFTEPEAEVLQVDSYSIARKGSGYYILKHVAIGRNTITTQVSEPNMLVITLSVLAQKIRKDLGV
jgi:hypothetical protein